MGYNVSTGAAYAVLYLVLSLFTGLAIISAGYCGKYADSVITHAHVM